MTPRYDPADPTAYVRHVRSLVGDHDPLELLAHAPERVARAVAGLSEDAAREVPGPGAWSVLQIVRHLADSEIVYGYRIRLIAAADRPPIPGYDQDAWADALAYHRGAVADALLDYADARRVTLALLRALPADAWDRVGLHSERGEESVRDIATLLAGHDLNHEGQIARTRAVVSA
ncbi:DinB family protein [Rubrivirga sp. IMCC45206]|uniref:DinB family protein n=1 Tax=Rubrivirga sp. IMCC45206 TaxID=3391614 RepID=UPI00398FD444